MASQKNISTTDNTALNTPVEEIKLDKTQLNLIPGGEVQLNATVSPSNASSTGVSWESSDSEVVEVSNGKITAKGIGDAVITAKTEGKDKDGKQISTSCDIEVIGVTVSPNPFKASEGQKIQLNVSVYPLGLPIQWIYENIKAYINEENVLTILGYETGEAKIKACINKNGITYSDEVIVYDPNVSISLGDTIKLTKNEKKTFDFVGIPEGYSISKVKYEYSNEGIVEAETEEATNTITANSVGETTITASITAEDGNNGTKTFEAEFKVIVSNVSISLGDTVKLTKNEKKTFDFIGIPEGYKISGVEYTYSPIENVKAITDIANGNATNTITANSVGETTITASITAEDGNNGTKTFEAEFKVIVSNVSISLGDPVKLTKNEEKTFDFVGIPEGYKISGVEYTYSTANIVEAKTDIANGNATNTITAKSVGETTITATITAKKTDEKGNEETETYYATCKVSVYDSKISISLDDPVKLTKNEKKTFDFIGIPDGYSIDDTTYTYSLSDIVEVETEEATNTITAKSVGETTVTASITATKKEEGGKEDKKTYYAEYKVIVFDNSRINEGSITLKVDETIALNTKDGLFLTIDDTPLIKENTAKNENTNTVSSSSDENNVKVEWKSSDEKIVKVSDDGAKLIPTGVGTTIVTASSSSPKGDGTTIVTASSSSPEGDGKCAVTVLPPFYLNKSVTTILLGGEETLRATLNLIDSNGVKIDWSIEDESCVGLIDTSDTYTKIIKGTATGTAKITASCQIPNSSDTSPNISYSESCNVTVVSNHKEAIIKHVDNIIPQAEEQNNKGYSLDITFRTSTKTDKPKEESKTLNLGVAKQFAIDEKAISVMLSSVRLHKEMYKPGCLELVLETTASLKDFSGIVTLKYEKDDDKQDTVASTYYIFEKKKKGDYVTLVAYSVDKFLTIDKFCQAFTGKTLVTDIVEKTLSSNNTDNTDNNIRFFCNYITKAETSNYTTTKELRHLCVNKANTNETLLPYSVQYNESFYDFLVRLCNRNGEFLFVEDNQLHIGTPINDSPLDITSGYDSQSKITTDYEIEETECYCNGESDGFFLNCSETITPNSVSTSNKETTSSNSCFSSNERIYPEEYLTKTTKHEDDNYVELDEFMRAMDHVSSAIKSLTNCHTVYEAVVDFGINEAWDAGSAKCNQNKVNQKYKEKYEKGGEYEFSFEGLLLNGSFYKNISTNGEKAANKKLVVTCSTYKNHKLGDTLEINGTNYVVCGVRSGVKLIDGAIKSENITRYKEYFEMELLPYINTDNQKAKPYPIPLKELRIRKATAQRAKVTNNFDPERLGRVRVRYPWQSEKDNDTPWIRISYPMASGEAGFMFTPDENDEVLVDYEDGNIEHPYIIGSFYNADNKPSPNANSYDNSTKTISSTNGHHISFNDTPPDVFVPNMLPGIISTLGKFGLYNDTKLMNLDKSLGGGFEIADLNGFYRIQGSTDERNITISSPIGDIKLDAYTGISISAPNGDVNIEGKNVKITARNNLTLESGVNIDSPYFWSRGKGKEIGKSFLEYAGNRAVSEVIDLSLMRVWFETISRPIGGTMLLKSHRFMRLETGKGETEIVKQRLRDSGVKDIAGFFVNISGNLKTYSFILNNLKKYIKLIKECIDDIERARDISNNAQNDKLVDLIDANNFNTYAKGNNRDGDIIYKKQNPTAENTNKIKGLYDAYQNIKNKKTEIEAITLTTTTKGYFNADFEKISDFVDSPYVTLTATGVINAVSITEINLKKGLWKEFSNDEELKNYLLFDTPAQQSSNSFKIDGTNYDIKVEPRKRDKAANILQGIQKYAFDNTSGLMDDKVWSMYDTGNLLISNEETHTYHLEKDGTFKKVQNGVEGFAKTLKDIITNATI